MRLPTAVIIAKAAAYVLIGALTPLAASLAQWANSGEQPNGVMWIVIVAGALVGGATQLLSFLSSAYSDYVQTKPGGTPGPGPTALAAARPIDNPPPKP